MERRDQELGDLFNDFRRSTAVRQILLIRSEGWITDEEFARFSEFTRNWVEMVLDTKPAKSSLLPDPTPALKPRGLLAAFQNGRAVDVDDGTFDEVLESRKSQADRPVDIE